MYRRSPHIAEKMPWLKVLTTLTSIKYYPIFIEDTSKYEEYKDRNPNEGFATYIKAASRNLRNGGIVPIALQAGRRATLYEKPVTAALSSLMNLVNHKKDPETGKGFDKFAVLFLGLEHPGTEDYSVDYKKFNPRKKYRLNIGRTLTAEEIFSQVGNGHMIDSLGYRELEMLVPESYRRKKT